MAQDTDTESPVALKLLLPHLCELTEHVRMFLDEARLVSSLRHENVVRAVAFGQAGHRYYFAMEYVPGRDLAAVAQRAWSSSAGLSPAVALLLIATAARGLHHAHRFEHEGRPLCIVHRDVCPQNLMLCTSGAVKVLDFGVARVAGRHDDDASSGKIIGTAAYCAPEQLTGAPVDARADVFSLGVVLHELLTGRRLFRRDSEHRTMLAVIEDAIPQVSELRPGLRALDATLARALQREPDQRFDSAQAFGDALLSLLPSGALGLDGVMASLFPDAPSA